MTAQRTVKAGEIRDHWVCHFQFWDRPLTGLVDIDGQHWWAELSGGVYRLTLTGLVELDGQHWWAELSGGVYRLTQVELTPECREFLDEYRAAYHHCCYQDGKRPAHDGRPLKAFGDKWGKRNPIQELAEHARG